MLFEHQQAAAAARLAEEARIAEEAGLATDARLTQEGRLHEEAQLAEQARLAEQTQVLEAVWKADDARLADEARRAEEARETDARGDADRLAGVASRANDPVERAVTLSAPAGSNRGRRTNATRRSPVPERRSRAVPFLVASLALIVVVVTGVARAGVGRDQGVAALTDARASAAAGTLPSSATTPGLSASATTVASAEPSGNPRSNPATPKPDRPPAPPPTPKTPKPTPKPDPTPERTPRLCAVIDLVGLRTNQAQTRWNEAGFRGLVTFNPDPPKHYIIETQTLVPGDVVRCSSGIEVQGTTP